ncbi:MAG: hypothetical protein R2747_19985 [Pyrinomonadaceae bacterium]
MNVFEDLIDELKEEDLLEETVIERAGHEEETLNATVLEVSGGDSGESKSDAAASEEILETERFLSQLEAEEQKKQVSAAPTGGAVPVSENFTDHHFIVQNSGEIPEEENGKKPKQPLSEVDFYRKRAMEEVSCLQMVDLIFSNVEREQVKVMPKPYDDLRVKKVLHGFMQVSGGINSPEHAEAEFQLMQETESWYAALAARDAKISVENLRYCCETTKPPLSPPALLALARFYRNSPFSEDVRNKFDLIITRLFSRDLEFEKRELVFSRSELVGHLTELYTEWESILLYPDKDDPELESLVYGFDDFISRARKADRFEELIESAFFKEFRNFKKGASENFYAPTVAASAIECNIKIGNRYLELLEREQENFDPETLAERFGLINDQLISNATSKTLELVNVLEELRHKPKTPLFNLNELERKAGIKRTGKKGDSGLSKGKYAWIFGVNKLILGLTIATVLLTGVLYFWVEMGDSPLKKSADVVEFNLADKEFKNYVLSARISNEALFAIASPAWGPAPKEQKEEILMKMVMAGKTNNYKKVHLLDPEGKTLAAATEEKVEIK